MFRVALLATCSLPLLRTQPADTADAILHRALERADLFDWADAAPDFVKAEQMFHAAHDDRNALYAQVGVLRATMEDRSLTDVKGQLEHIIIDPETKGDPPLLLFASIAKADADGELNADDAKKDWAAIEALAKQQGNEKWAVRALGEQSFSEFLTGNISKGRVLIATALAKTQRTGDFAGQIRYLTAIGAALTQIHQYDQAIDYLNKASALIRVHPEVGYPFVTNEYTLEALVGLHKLSRAEALAEEIIAQASRRNKKVKQVQAMITLARIQEQIKRPEDAINTLSLASTLAKEGDFKRLLADTQYELANLYRARGDNRAAEQYLQRGIQITQDTPELWLMPSRLQSLAELKVADGQFLAADGLYRRATDLIDTLLGGTTNAQVERSLMAVNSQIFVQHFQLAADKLKNTPEAYRIIEEVRGRSSLDMLRGALPAANANMAGLNREISRLRQQLAQASDASRRAHLKLAIFQKEQQRWTTDTSPGETIPRAAEIIPLRQAQRELSGEEAVLEYVVGEKFVYCLEITRRSAHVTALAPVETVEKALNTFLNALKEKQSAVQSGRELFSLLIAPLSLAAEKSRLVVVPDGKLHLLPFDALIDASGQYLVQTKDVVYAPSVSTVLLLRKRPAIDAANALLAIGGLPYAGSSQLQAAVRGDSSTTTLADIPGSRDEVRDAAKLLQAKNARVDLLLDENGTKAALERALQKRYSMIHLAVHAVADSKNPDRAALFLLSDKNTGTDGTLDAAEVVTLPIRANVVVLSACDTAAGRLEGQEGIATLSRAFLLAGARTVISTLWSVDDTFSRFLMSQFYTKIAEGQTASDALRNAKLQLLRTFGPQATPYRWAAYRLEGAGNYAVPLQSSDHEQRSNSDTQGN